MEKTQTCKCGEPEDGGQFGWFDAPDGKTYCNACGSQVAVKVEVSNVRP